MSISAGIAERNSPVSTTSLDWSISFYFRIAELQGSTSVR